MVVLPAAAVLAPEPLGREDVVFAGGRILALAEPWSTSCVSALTSGDLQRSAIAPQSATASRVRGRQSGVD
jgi:hypothetical protein